MTAVPSPSKHGLFEPPAEICNIVHSHIVSSADLNALSAFKAVHYEAIEVVTQQKIIWLELGDEIWDAPSFLIHSKATGNVQHLDLRINLAGTQQGHTPYPSNAGAINTSVVHLPVANYVLLLSTAANALTL
jgi:hypothetical protein